MSEVSEMMEKFDVILDEDKNSLVAMSVTPGLIFKRIKSISINYLLDQSVLDKNDIDCLDVPETETDPDTDSKYFYFFEISGSIPSCRELRVFVLSIGEILWKENLDENNFDVQNAKKCINKFVENGWVKIILDASKVLREVKLENVLLLIRVADHDRDKLAIDLEKAERLKSQRSISKAQGKLNRFDIRQSIVDKDKYFDVGNQLDTEPVKINGIET